MTLAEKRARLQEILTEMDSVLVAYSGGVDSTLLLRVAHDVLGNRAVAATASSPTYPEDEIERALAFAREMGVRVVTLATDELENPSFVANPPDRCYHCKKELFAKLRDVADGLGLRYVADGTNVDDLGDLRPGRRAAAEIGVRSPLEEAGFSKDDIRSLSHELGLPTWDKPAMACFSSRIPYGVTINGTVLNRVGEAERFLRELGLGLGQLRVRHHGDLARVEVPPADIAKLADPAVAGRIVAGLRATGYTYVTLDLAGYRTGSMNEVLPKVEVAAKH
ncbi:MAG: ATP-dependent sacrificial sulfur transferase LarE [Chloroflexota bacterium]